MDSPHLAIIILQLNLLQLLMGLKIKRLDDALQGAVGQLQSAESEFMTLVMVNSFTIGYREKASPP